MLTNKLRRLRKRKQRGIGIPEVLSTRKNEAHEDYNTGTDMITHNTEALFSRVKKGIYMLIEQALSMSASNFLYSVAPGLSV